jgi:ribosomal protein S18 acetylase RimI-like enzyme
VVKYVITSPLGDDTQMRVRAAVVDDAPAMGRVMVEAWLTAHRGQMPDAAWQKRVDEWTPEVSARAWARLLNERAQGDQARGVLLVAEDDAGDLVGLVLGTEAEDDTSGSTADIGALYVLPDQQGRGIGRRLLQEAASESTTLGFSSLQIGVLTANLPARRFYEAMGGREAGQRTFDEEGVLLPGTVYAWPNLAALRLD